ncbi:MAG: type I-E CRISPR-associated protein Cse2/CasB [Thermoguttaceae bacterium]|jgi:CRISPR type I-E-associated protein CasB/Cse2|nr:type I-E CRISPR-associated protein Cse2/CasB [Thermoguttaceae bacterium]
MTATLQYIQRLEGLRPGDLKLLRIHAGQPLDESVAGFDLFAGLWWPLRQASQRAPRRAVAWLIAKLYASYPIPHSAGDTLARQLGRCCSRAADSAQFRQKFDHLLLLPLHSIEPALQWALRTIAAEDLTLDWVQLTDDLSIWERESTRLKWAGEFLKAD